MNADAANAQKSRACQCPMCTATPAPTYTRDYMMECLARWYVNATLQQREEYLSELRKQKAWQARINDLRVVAEHLGLPTKNFPR
jgi:hypothetical protein